MKSRPSRVAAATDNRAMYDADFFAWSQQTAALLRSRRFSEVDLENTAQEIEDMGRRDLRELNGRVRVVLVHLLKWRLQPRKRSASWRRTLLTQRVELEALLVDSPSPRSKLGHYLPRTYARAVQTAMLETGMHADKFPIRCPFTLEQILDDEFLPT